MNETPRWKVKDEALEFLGYYKDFDLYYNKITKDFLFRSKFTTYSKSFDDVFYKIFRRE